MLAACQRGQQDFLSAKFTAGCSECRDPEVGEWLRLPGPAGGAGPPACLAVRHDRPSRAGLRGREYVPAPFAGPARSRAEPWGSCPLSAKSPCARSHEHAPPKAPATHGCSRRDGHHAQPVPPCPARRTPTLRRFTPSQTRRVDGALSRTVARGAWTNKRYERGRPCSALLLRDAPVPSSRPVSPGAYRRGESTPHACIVHSAGDSSACCERRPRTASPRKLPARGRAPVSLAKVVGCCGPETAWHSVCHERWSMCGRAGR